VTDSRKNSETTTSNLSSDVHLLPAAARIKRRILGHKSFLIGGSLVAFFLLIAILAPWVMPKDPFHQDLTLRMINPFWHVDGNWDHLLGTDQVGRDYLSRLIYGTRISLLVGFSSILISGLIGSFFGILSGYFGGRLGAFINFLITVRLSMPMILVALAVVSLFRGSFTVVILVLGFTLWERFAVVLRAATQQIRSSDYVAAADAAGCSTSRIILSELLPNVLNPLIIVATVDIARAILAEAALSFLGMGVQPPIPSWGLMVNEGKNFMFFHPWMIVLPGACIFILVLAMNMLGDGIRDITSPEAKS